MRTAQFELYARSRRLVMRKPIRRQAGTCNGDSSRKPWASRNLGEIAETSIENAPIAERAQFRVRAN